MFQNNLNKIFSMISIATMGLVLIFVFQNCSGSGFVAKEDFLSSLNTNPNYQISISGLSVFKDGTESMQVVAGKPFSVSVDVINNKGQYGIQWEINGVVHNEYADFEKIIVTLTNEDPRDSSIVATVTDLVTGETDSQVLSVAFAVGGARTDTFHLTHVFLKQEDILSQVTEPGSFPLGYFYEGVGLNVAVGYGVPSGSVPEITWSYKRYSDDPTYPVVNSMVLNESNLINEFSEVSTAGGYTIMSGDVLPGIYELTVSIVDTSGELFLVDTESISFGRFRVNSKTKAFLDAASELAVTVADATSNISESVSVTFAHGVHAEGEITRVGEVKYSYIFNEGTEVVIGHFSVDSSDVIYPIVQDTLRSVDLAFTPSELFVSDDIQSVDLHGLFYVEDSHGFKVSEPFTVSVSR
ncbi:MAG: hypothetical protein HOO06_10530 [Bdellovibrionaceae bacterium]|nr:hypothetical protein [Pseudobdellovibrionaceae bacterium]